MFRPQSTVLSSDVNRLAGKLGVRIKEKDVPDYHVFLCALEDMAQTVLAMDGNIDLGCASHDGLTDFF